MGESRTAMDQATAVASPSRRTALAMGAGAVGALMLPSAVMASGFKGTGPMSFSTAQDWIRTFFNSAEEIIDLYDPGLVKIALNGSFC